MGGEGYILIGYHSIEARFALRLAADLKNEGVNLWMDRLDVQPGDNREATQESALSDCAALLPLLSPDYVASSYGKHELNFVQQGERPIIPVLLRPVSAVDWLSEAGLRDREYVDMTEWHDTVRYKDALNELINRIRALKLVKFDRLVNPERRYLNGVLARIEAQKTSLEFVRLSYQASTTDTALIRPAPRIDPNRGLNGPFILRDAPLAQAKYLHSLKVALQEFPRLVLAGAGGSGKTTTLYRLAEDAVRAYKAEPRRTPLPFLVNLAEWQPDISLENFLQSRWSLKADPLDWMARGWITLYLDGLDEMGTGSAERIDMLRAWLHGANAPQRAVITCRLANYDDRTNLNLPVICIEDMTDSRIQEMVRLYLGEAEAPALLQKFTVRDDAVVRNPLLLRLIIYIHMASPGGELPHTNAEIIRRFIEWVWERERVLQSPDWIPLEDLFTGLAKLGFDMLQRGTSTSIDKAYAAQSLGNERLVDALCSAGLLELNGELVSFMHPQMLYVLAAMQLQHESLHEYLQRPSFSSTGRRVAAHGDETLIMLTGLAAQADTPIGQIADVDPYLAAECLAGGCVVTDVTRRQVVSRLVYFATTADEGRAAAIQAIELLSHGDPLPLLLEQMRQGVWEERVRAGDFLQQIGSLAPADLMDVLSGWQFNMDDNVAVALRQAGEEALPVLLRLLNDAEWTKRRGAAWALGELADKASVPGLVAAIKDTDISVRREAVSALRRMQDADAVPRLLMALRDEDNSVRKAAAQALAEVGASAVPGLLRMLRDDNTDVRRIAAGVLGRTGDSSAVPALVECLSDSNIDIRAMSVVALGQIGHPGVAAELADHLTDTSVPRWSTKSVSELTVNALMQIRTEEAVDIVEKWRARLSDGGAGAGGSAADAKKKLLEQTAPPPPQKPKRLPEFNELLKAIRHKDWRVRRKALDLLGQTGDTAAIPGLLTGLKDEDGQVRWSAVKALGNFPMTTEIIQNLLVALRDADYLVSDTAADILARAGQPALPGLMDAAQEASIDVRGLALEALGKIGDPAAINLLVDALKDERMPRWENKPVQQISLEALRLIDDHEARVAIADWQRERLPPESAPLILHPDVDENSDRVSPAQNDVMRLLNLVEELHDPDWQVRQHAAKELNRYAKSLRGIRNPHITERLTALLQDDESFVRMSAVEALAFIGDMTAVPALIQMLKDKGFTVRIAAVRALSEIGHISALPAIMELLKESVETHEVVREVAAEVLGKFGNEKALPALVSALSDSEGFVRRAAVEALGETASLEAVPWLIQALHEDDSSMRWSAAEALGKIGAAEAVEHLARYLNDTYQPPLQEPPERRLCDVVVMALEQIGTPEAHSVLDEWRGAVDA